MVLSIFLPHSSTSTSFKTQYQAELIEKVKDCITRCDEDDVCLVISGHSQGGAIATVASLELSGLNTNYEVIIFAAPPSVTKDPEHFSPHMDFGRQYNFGKGLYTELGSGGGVAGLVFDKVPFLGPDLIPGFHSFSVGEFIILSSEDSKRVAFAGSNTEKVFNPWDNGLPLPFGDAHFIYKDPGSKFFNTGYFQLVRRIRDEASFPVPVKGFGNGVHCGRGEHAVDLCDSDRCDRAIGELHPTCKSKLSDDESCNHRNYCVSERCDETSWANPTKMVCHSKNANGELCNEDSDCLSGRCASNFPSRCKPMAGPGEPCANNKDCIDGYYCPAGFNRKCKRRGTSATVDNGEL